MTAEEAPKLPLKPVRTPEQQARYEEVQRRSRLIQAGVVAPKSGTFGRPPKL